MTSIVFDDIYILSRRPYRETSFLVESFSASRGRMSFVARGVRKKGAGIYEPFMPLKILLSRHKLPFCQKIESNGSPIFLTGKLIYAGMYLNELVSISLSYDDPAPELFDCYQRTLIKLNHSPHLALREFEYALVCHLGYGFDWTCTLDGDAVQQGARYRYLPQAGIIIDSSGSITGDALIQMKNGCLAVENQSVIAKMMFEAISPHLRREMNTKQWFR